MRPSRTSSRCSTTGIPARSMNSRPKASSGRPAAVPTDASRSRQVALPNACRSRKARRPARNAESPDEVLELLEHAGRLVVDDRAVVALRLREIVERLPEGSRPGRLVHAVGRRLVAEVERLPRVGIGLEVRQRLRGHERGEALLEPEVVEPAHRHQVAEPLVRRLVQDGGEPAEPARQGGALAKDEAVLRVEDGAGVLHAAERERRREDEVELAERVRSPEPALHPAEGAMVERQQGVEIGFGRARAADVRRDRAAAHGRARPIATGRRRTR